MKIIGDKDKGYTAVSSMLKKRNKPCKTKGLDDILSKENLKEKLKENED